MSLGNVSYSSVNEQYFRQALTYLRNASEIGDYTLSPYLQKYVLPVCRSNCGILSELTVVQLPRRVWATDRLTTRVRLEHYCHSTVRFLWCTSTIRLRPVPSACALTWSHNWRSQRSQKYGGSGLASRLGIEETLLPCRQAFIELFFVHPGRRLVNLWGCIGLLGAPGKFECAREY